MKTTIIKLSRNEVVLNRIELKELAEKIRKSPDGKMEDQVAVLRRNYRFYKAVRLEDGQIKLDSDRYVALPRICFAVEFDKYKKKARLLRYNGLVVVEVNGLKTYEEAVAVRNLAARMDETVMAFLGASGKSVKIVCRGELFGKEDGRGQKEDGRLPNLYNS